MSSQNNEASRNTSVASSTLAARAAVAASATAASTSDILLESWGVEGNCSSIELLRLSSVIKLSCSVLSDSLPASSATITSAAASLSGDLVVDKDFATCQISRLICFGFSHSNKGEGKSASRSTGSSLIIESINSSVAACKLSSKVRNGSLCGSGPATAPGYATSVTSRLRSASDR